MRKFLTIISLLFFISCSNNTNEKVLTDSISVAKTNKIITQTNYTDSITASHVDSIITNRFLLLVKFIDSSGFKYDTIRYKKVTHYNDTKNAFFVDNYCFYDLPFQNSFLFDYYKREDNYGNDFHLKNKMDSLRVLNHKEKFNIKIHEFEKVESIKLYFYTQKVNENPEWKTDGIIEEWKFPDNYTAKLIAESLGENTTYVYFNRGAYLCYIDNYVYIFHSRCNNFYKTLRKFYDKFVRENNLIMVKNGKTAID